MGRKKKDQSLEALTNFKLSTQQKDALPYVQWLFDCTSGQRGTGRTTLLAFVFINQAMRNPGLKVMLVDHCKLTNESNLLNVIQYLLSRMPEDLKNKFELTNKYILHK